MVLDNDPTVSRQHAVVTILDNGTATIRDLNSTSGTFVDNKRISAETPVTQSSQIKLGNTVLTLGQIMATRRKTKVHRPSGISASSVALTSKKIVGRAPSNDIPMSAADVSSSHCVIGFDSDGNPAIADLGSSNGTFVNGNRISGVTRLKKGDTVRLAANTHLNWENYLKPKGNRKMTIAITSIVASLAVIALVGVIVWKNWNRQLSPEEIYDKYRTSVVMILNYNSYAVKLHGKSPSDIDSRLAVIDNVYVNSDGEVESGISGSSGTGFFISKDGKIMTNKHVLYPMGDEEQKAKEKIKEAITSMLYSIARSTGEYGYAQLASDIDVEYVFNSVGVARNDTHVSSADDLLKATPIKGSKDDDVDVAILQLNTKTTPEDAVIVDVANFSDPKHRKIGSRIYTIGFPKNFAIGSTAVGLEANNQSGEITQDRGENVYGHNITIHQGASGSPVFDSYGQFAGIIVSGFLGLSQGYNHAVQPEKASEFANK
ncbi:MAG: FHA domain-containing protein [Clostridium sp.]|nr:FHA domain-containing protein [Clostridium sp.]